MKDNGFNPVIPSEVEHEVRRAEMHTEPGVTDMREMLWSSIDNDDTRDLDQLEVAVPGANGTTRMHVAIADVDAFVPKGSHTDSFAAFNSTSVYTGIHTFPMLPERLSTDLTSLVEGEDRLAIVMTFDVADNGDVSNTSVSRGLVRNKAQLAYESVSRWLDGGEAPAKVAASTELQQQLRLQDKVATALRKRRYEKGALELDTIEARTIARDGEVKVELTRKGRARDLIEDLMIAANVAMARTLEDRGEPSIRRVVRKPERWNRIVAIANERGAKLPAEPDAAALAQFLSAQRVEDPDHYADLSISVVKLMGPGEYVASIPGEEEEGHFGLAVHDYTHSTAPNRRYSDLIVQRLIKASLADEPNPYDNDTLSSIAQHCTERENAARKVERTMRKLAAAASMSNRVGETFDAIVTGSSSKGVYVRLINPPVEGRVTSHEEGLDVGERTRVRLAHVDAERGFIDFARI